MQVCKSLIHILILFGFFINLFSLPVLAQNAGNAINFTVPKISKDGADQATRRENANAWIFDGELTLDDQIKYGWSGTDLNLAYKQSPARGGGYLQIYLNDDTNPANLILEQGTSPLLVSSIASRLKEGPNKILFVYIDSTARATLAGIKVSFTFNFRNITKRPQLNIIQPQVNSVIGRGAERDFILQLTNFELESNDSRQPNRGKLNVYVNSVTEATRIGTFSISQNIDGKTLVSFNSRDLEIAKIPDGLNTKLIFSLTSTSGNILGYENSLVLRTNYNNSLDVGLPRVTITEPRKDRTNQNVDGEQKFIVQIDNFQILTEPSKDTAEDGKGYLQIFVDNKPIQTLWPKNDFTLNEIGLIDSVEGRKTIQVQLVNKNFTKLSPDAMDSIDVIYIPNLNNNSTDTPQVQNNVWRILIVVLTIVLVVGGIAILITKG